MPTSSLCLIRHPHLALGIPTLFPPSSWDGVGDNQGWGPPTPLTPWWGSPTFPQSLSLILFSPFVPTVKKAKYDGPQGK